MNEYKPESKILERIDKGSIDLENCNTRCKIVHIVCEDAYDDRVEIRCPLGHILSRAGGYELAISNARRAGPHND